VSEHPPRDPADRPGAIDDYDDYDDEEPPHLPLTEREIARLAAYEDFAAFLFAQKAHRSWAQLSMRTGIHKSALLRIVNHGAIPSYSTVRIVIHALLP
jgi:hypothetical protein